MVTMRLLTVYMGFLTLLDPYLTKKKQTAYREHREEEVRRPDPWAP